MKSTFYMQVYYCFCKIELSSMQCNLPMLISPSPPLGTNGCVWILKMWLWLFFHWLHLWGIFLSIPCVLWALLISLAPAEMKLLQSRFQQHIYQSALQMHRIQQRHQSVKTLWHSSHTVKHTEKRWFARNTDYMSVIAEEIVLLCEINFPLKSLLFVRVF